MESKELYITIPVIGESSSSEEVVCRKFGNSADVGGMISCSPPVFDATAFPWPAGVPFATFLAGLVVGAGGTVKRKLKIPRK